jgi:putative intracellular protease/amidase
MLAICHGPAALLSSNLENNKENFIYKGYKVLHFLNDAVDAQGPIIIHLVQCLGFMVKKLNDLGVVM